MFIVPMDSSIDTSRITSFLDKLEKATGAGGVGEADRDLSGTGFRDVFEGLIRNVEDAEAVAEADAYKLSIGELEDPHTAMIDAAKAELTLSTMVQIRNKVLDAYSEIMRINL
jgi:flagellar hook-basal body complex protein FliE